jgi:uncharacterized protein
VSIYLDASVILSNLVEEPASPAVRQYLLVSGQQLLISDFAAAEVASGLSRLVRMQLLDRSDAIARLEDFDVWRAAISSQVDVHSSDVRLACAYVRRFELRLRAPDALNLAIARRLDVALVTLDGRMAAAARSIGIAVETPV